MVATKPEVPTVEEIAQRFRDLRIHQDETPEPNANPIFTEWLQRILDEQIEREIQKHRSETEMTRDFER